MTWRTKQTEANNLLLQLGIDYIILRFDFVAASATRQ